MSNLLKSDYIREEKENRSTIRNIKLLFAIFSVIILTTGIISYDLAAMQLKTQLTNKCQALAATVAAIIAEDSDKGVDDEAEASKRRACYLCVYGSIQHWCRNV